jgi:hypothetical protein
MRWRPHLCDEFIKPGVFAGGSIIARDFDDAVRLLREIKVSKLIQRRRLELSRMVFDSQKDTRSLVS